MVSESLRRDEVGPSEVGSELSLKERLAAGQLCRVFALSRIVHPVVIELFGCVGGFHGFWLDQEHASYTSEQMAAMAIAARANRMEMFVRVPPTGYWQVTQCLEAGAAGVMGAQMRTLDEVRQFAAWARFAPRGTRGLNGNGRDADYTLTPLAEFVERANQRAWVGVQIETREALETVEAIAAEPGVDFLFVGPSDLSLALGLVGKFHDVAFWNAMHRIAHAARQAGKPWGCVAPDAAFAQKAVEAGCLLLTLGGEVLALRRGIEQLHETFRTLFCK